MSLQSAIARMDAIIARVHRDCLAEQTVRVYADHYLGCTLHPDHEGDCILHRPQTPRYVLRGGRE